MNNNKRVLIIERDRVIGLDLQAELENNGYMVFRPLSLVDTEVILGKNTPDLIIANSDMQGQVNFTRVKKLFYKRHLKIICIGTVTNEAMKKCDGINIIGAFSKPVDAKKVVTYVDRCFSVLGQK